MKTSKEFIERLHSDEEFAANFAEEVQSKVDADSDSYKDIIIAAAAERDYEISSEELEEMTKNTEELSEEELGKVSGGTVTILVSVLVSTSAVGVTLWTVIETQK